MASPTETPASPPAAGQRIPRAVWALGFVSLLMDVSSEMIHALLPVFLVTTLAASALTVGLIEGAAEATALIVKVFSGALSDYLGRRKPLALLGYGLAAFTKPFFAFASSAGLVFTARIADRIGKGIRGAPRDALLADVTPPALRGAAFGLRQSLDTVGAFLGPMIAIGLMLLWANDVRAVFMVAIVPALLSVAVLFFGVQEPVPPAGRRAVNPIRRENLRRLPGRFWWVVGVAAIFTLARFSEAFLLLRAQEGGVGLAWIPAVLIAMNVVYSLSAYPFGALADKIDGRVLLALGLLVLIAADLLLAWSNRGAALWGGIALWGLHMGMTQGLLSAMVAHTAPSDLRGTAFGLFNLVSGVALLVASALAGFLWDRYGAPVTFLAGAGFSALTLIALALPASRAGLAQRDT